MDAERMGKLNSPVSRMSIRLGEEKLANGEEGFGAHKPEHEEMDANKKFMRRLAARLEAPKST